MSLPRSLDVLRTRWFVIVAVAVIGGGSALVAALLRNQQIEQLFEGVAPISILRLDGEPDNRYAQRLNTALTQAEQAVAGELADEGLTVTSDPAEGTIRFVATAASADEALESATQLRAAYLNSRPEDPAEGQLGPVLDALATEIALVEAEVADLNQIGADEVAEVQREALRVQLEVATKDLVTIQARLLDPGLSAEERADLDTQESAAESTITAIGPLLERLPASTETIADTQTRLEAMVLQRRLRDLESQYISVALRQAEGGGEGLVGVPFVIEQSSDPVSPMLSIFAGVIAGAFLGGMAVIATDRLSEPVRTVDDVPGRTTIRVSRRPRKLAGSIGWYQTAQENGRRVDIQALRARIDRSLGRGKTVLFVGVDAPSRDVIDLAIDLASAVAVTGRTVMFIDTRVAGTPVPTWEAAGISLAEILLVQSGGVLDRSVVKSLLWDRSPVAPNLMVVPAGALVDDPVDTLASMAFAAVVDEARDLVDLVVLGTGDVTDPMSEAVAGRTRLAVLAAQKDRTRKKDLMAGAASLEQLGVSVAAVALLVGTSSSSTKRAVSTNTSHVSATETFPEARHLGEP